MRERGFHVFINGKSFMLAFLVQRISQALLVMFVISIIAFAIQDGL
ncbi:MAG TPA: ABC transporter permease, partial [Marinobacter hydrocarbonoclasticus]|nr:ABC transporter permease [Marinobacter nauticus]